MGESGNDRVNQSRVAGPRRGPARWLVTGASGLLGSALMAWLAPAGRSRSGQGPVVVGTCRPTRAGQRPDLEAVELRDGAAVQRLLDDVRPTHIAHLAGITSLIEARRDAADAWRLNSELTEQLAAYADDTDAWLLYPSSDFVFDGTLGRAYTEADEPNPLNPYAETKRAGERAVLRVDVGAVLRLSLLHCGGPGGPETTMSRLVDRVTLGETVDAVVDERRTPLAVQDAALAIAALGDRRHRGLLHLGGPDCVTPAEMITALAFERGCRARLNYISRKALGDVRPANASLSSLKIRSLLPGLPISRLPGLSSPSGGLAREA